MNKSTRKALLEFIAGFAAGVFLIASLVFLVHCLLDDAVCHGDSQVISCSSR